MLKLCRSRFFLPSGVCFLLPAIRRGILVLHAPSKKMPGIPAERTRGGDGATEQASGRCRPPAHQHVRPVHGRLELNAHCPLHTTPRRTYALGLGMSSERPHAPMMTIIVVPRGIIVVLVPALLRKRATALVCVEEEHGDPSPAVDTRHRRFWSPCRFAVEAFAWYPLHPATTGRSRTAARCPRGGEKRQDDGMGLASSVVNE